MKSHEAFDTSKYAGHASEPWIIINPFSEQRLVKGGAGQATILAEIFGRNVEEQISNAQLISDAPLLLAEVGRLQGVMRVSGGILKDIDFAIRVDRQGSKSSAHIEIMPWVADDIHAILAKHEATK